MTERRHQVVVVGGGFGGLNATRALAKADVDVTVVDRTNHHLFQPLLYQVAAGILPEGLVAPALRSVIKKQANARALLAEVTSMDLDTKVVHAVAPDGRKLALPYDTLVVAGGATHSYFGRDQFSEFAPGMKTLEDARHLRSHILSAFEMAELATDPQERSEWLTFVVIGAGPTGVELVGQVAELAHIVLPRDYRSVDTTEAKILLLEGAGAVLGPFDPKLQRYTQARLEKMGVEVRLNTLAVDMDQESITVKGPGGMERIPTRTRIWAAGVQASPLAKMLAEATGAETDRAGRLKVNPDTTVPGHPEIYAVGDMMALDQLPGVAQVAIQSGRHAAGQIKKRLAGEATGQPFKYFDKGSLATISRFSAVASVGRFHFAGLLGWLLWLVVHLLYLVGFKNRVTAVLHWFVSFIGRGRSERVSTFQQVFARRAMQEYQDRLP
jgi:NADH dehydrogenase